MRLMFVLAAMLVVAAPATSVFGQNNTCEWAFDGQCDEPRFGGTGACDNSTDAADCRGGDTCEWAFDGECDEPRFGGTGACPNGTDTGDCTGQPIAFEDDSCQWARDGECDELRFGGTGACRAGTDTADCQRGNLTAGADNSCEWAFDGECDEPGIGTGVCRAGTDAADCRGGGGQSAGADNSCEWAFDGECDEPGIGTGVCRAGTDAADCRGGGGQSSGADNSCEWAFDGECDEPGIGTGVCRAGTDAADCRGGGGTVTNIPGLGNNSCRWANDLECDDAQFGGTGFCETGTDADDCAALAVGGDNSCEWAFDNECDEPGIGLGYCASGSDTADCESVAFLRNRTNECATAFNGRCDEPDGGTGLCEAFADTADCIGRGRPPEARDHYFGRDDRFLPDVNQDPWRSIGLIDLAGGGTCTGTLVAPRLVLTAAHCVMDDDARRVEIPELFRAGARGDTEAARAQVIDAFAAPDYSNDVYDPGGGNGNDWAFITLDRDLSRQIPIIPIYEFTTADLRRIDGVGIVIDQAGYSWDTGAYLSGHIGCRVVDAFEDGTILHECDTAQGDSGSPLLYTVNGRPHIIAVDSQFYDNVDKNSSFLSANMAVDSRAFIAAARRLGVR